MSGNRRKRLDGRGPALLCAAALASLAPFPALAAPSQVAFGSARIESPVGGSFAVETAQKILSAIFLSGGVARAEMAPAGDPLTLAISEAGEGSPAYGRTMILSRDAVSVGIHPIRQADSAAAVRAATQPPALLILAQFN